MATRKELRQAAEINRLMREIQIITEQRDHAQAALRANWQREQDEKAAREMRYKATMTQEEVDGTPRLPAILRAM